MSLDGFAPAVRTKLQAFLSHAADAGSVATFDLDGTCEHHDTGEAVLLAMARRGWFSLKVLADAASVWEPFSAYPQVASPRPDFLRLQTDPNHLASFSVALIQAYQDLLRVAGKAVAYPWAGHLLAGKTIEQVRSFSRQVLQEEMARDLTTDRLSDPSHPEKGVLVASGLRTYEPMSRLIQMLQRKGITTWIISASNRWTVEVYAEMFLGIPRSQVLGVAPAIINGVIAAQSDPHLPLTVGPGKVEAIDRFIGRRPILAAGDTTSDWDMLCSATGIRLVIDQGAQEIRRQVRHRIQQGEGQWLIQPRFIDPVPGNGLEE